MRHSELQTFFRNIREKYHITQTVMAESLGITQPLLSFYENGKVNIPGKIINDLIKDFNLNDDEIEFLKNNRVSKQNLKAIEVLEELKFKLLNDKQQVEKIINEKIKELKK